jgi:hypothetical protein
MRRTRELWLRGILALALSLGLAGAAPAVAQESAKPADKKTEKKSDKKKADAQAGTETPDVEKERKEVARVLRGFQEGFEGKSSRRVTEMLDSKTFYDFPRFEESVQQFLDGSSEMRMFFRQSTSEVKGDKATLIVDAEMIFSSKSNAAADQKRKERIQFDFIKTPKGWKIYEISPRTFFTP